MSQQHPFEIIGSGDGPPRLTEELLLAYLEGRLSPEATREVEALLTEEGMDSDAAEGLLHVPLAEAQEMVGRLNRRMQRQLKRRPRHKKASTDLWTWVAVLLILLLIAVAYYLVHLLKKG